jgi:endonuclease YncB( thermonuclease family)
VTAPPPGALLPVAGRCIAVIDGDTFHAYLEAELRFLQTTVRASELATVRLLGIDCPEKRDPGGPAATAYTLKWVSLHAHLDRLSTQDTPLRFAGTQRDNFGRLLSVVTCGVDGASLNADLLLTANAVPYRALPHVDALLDLERGGYRSARRLLDEIGAP